MPPLPSEILIFLNCFAPLFTRPSFEHAKILFVGAILCRGARRVSSILRVMGLSHEKRFESYHRFLNRATWSGLAACRILLGLLIKLLPDACPVLIAVDDTIERRKGKNIRAKGCYRDACRSSKKNVIRCFGLKWLCFVLLVKLPYSHRHFALPFMTLLMYSKKANEQRNRVHKTIIDRTMTGIRLISRWINRPWILIGDGGFACVHLAKYCILQQVTFIARLRLDACLYEFPESKREKKRGRKREKGARIFLKTLVNDNSQTWQENEITWYGGQKKTVRLLSGIHLWYTAGEKPLPIRWVMVVHPDQPDAPAVFFTTALDLVPEKIVEYFVLRWNIEVTFEEVRAYLGVETQRQWSDKAIHRSTPSLMAIYSSVILIAQEMLKKQPLSQTSTAWYKKSIEHVTFSDLLSFVKSAIWQKMFFDDSKNQLNTIKIQLKPWSLLIDQLAMAA